MRKALFLIILFLILVGLVVFISSYLLGERTSFFGKATSGALDNQIVLENSYLFASPLLAEAGDREKIRVTVFILNSNGLGVAGKKVIVGSEKGLSMQEIQSTTDPYGKAVFDISATNPGDYVLEAAVGGVKLPQTVKVGFR